MSDALSEKISAGNPAPLGLAGFAFTTFVLSFANSGLFHSDTSGSLEAIAIVMALFWGGLAQFIAGLFEMRKGNTFGFTAFCSYGAFWFWFAFLFILSYMIGNDNGSVIGGGSDFYSALGISLILWGVFTFYMWIPAMHLNLTLNLVFLCLWITFFLLGFGNWTLASNATNGNNLIHLGGYVGILCAVFAAYGSFADVTNTIVEHKLPLGPAIKILGKQ